MSEYAEKAMAEDWTPPHQRIQREADVEEAMERLGSVTESLQKGSASMRMRLAKVLRPEQDSAELSAARAETGVELVDRLFHILSALEGVRDELADTERRCAL